MKYTDREAGDVAVIYWHILGESFVDTWQLFGQMIGCHVAQSWAATWHPGIGLFGLLIKILYSPPDSNRGPPPLPKPSQIPTCQRATVRYLSYEWFRLYFNSSLGMVWAATGLGLAPALGRVPYNM
jgi:hypothetical protein